MKLGNKLFNNESGAGLMEVLLAIAIVGAIMPFAYNGVMDMTNSIKDVSEAKKVIAWADPIMAYVRKNQDDWPSNAEVEFDEEEVEVIGGDEVTLGQSALVPFAGFIDKRTSSGGAMINAYLAFRPSDISEMRMASIAKSIGTDAAIVAPDGAAVSEAGWNISSDLFLAGDLIYRISDILAEDETQRYLHRTYLDEADMNTMFRDLDMAKHNIAGVGEIKADNIKASNANLWFVETPQLRADEAYFPDGATIDPSKATLASVRVSGDIGGFRNIITKKLVGVSGGAIWSQKGDMVADNVSVSGPVHVQRDLVIKSEFMRTVSGFSGIRAQSLSTSFVSADQLFFASGFGMTVSSELMYSTTMPPIKLGFWNFPSANGPRFSAIVLHKASSDDLGAILIPPVKEEFAPIMESGWKNK